LPPHISNAWFGPLTIRDRFWRFLGLNRAAQRPASVRLTLKSLETIALPNNLLAAGFLPDFTPALTAPVTDAIFAPSIDSSASAVAAPETNAATAAPPLGYSVTDSTAIALAGAAAPAPPSAPPLSADLVFQSGFTDLSTGPFTSSPFADALQATPPPSASASQSAAAASPASGGAAMASPPPAPAYAASPPVSATAPDSNAAAAVDPNVAAGRTQPPKPKPAQITIGISDPAPYQGESVTFTVTVVGYGATPTGAVDIVDGGGRHGL